MSNINTPQIVQEARDWRSYFRHDLHAGIYSIDMTQFVDILSKDDIDELVEVLASQQLIGLASYDPVSKEIEGQCHTALVAPTPELEQLLIGSCVAHLEKMLLDSSNQPQD